MKRLIAVLMLVLSTVVATGQAVVVKHKAGCTFPADLTYNWKTPLATCGSSAACYTDVVAGNTITGASGAAPTYSASGGPNSTKTIIYNGSTQYAQLTTAIPSGQQDFTIYAVFNITSLTNANPFTGGGSGSAILFEMTTAGHLYLERCNACGGNYTGTNTYAAGTPYAVIISSQGSTGNSQFYSCGSGTCTADGTGKTGYSTNPSYQTTNLGYQQYVGYFDGQIPYFAVQLGGIASAADRTAFAGCVKSIYGF